MKCKASVTDDKVGHIKIGENYQDITLQKNDKGIYSATLSDNPSDLDNAYVTADDGVQNTKLGITIIRRSSN